MDLNNIIQVLTQRDPLPQLVPDHIWDNNLTSVIKSVPTSPLVIAGLYLLNDDIHNCHIIAQEYETPDGNYWHAILHRREPDYWNSKYWYKRVGDHPVIREMKKGNPEWDPFTFVDQCESDQTEKERKLQMEEMGLLLFHCMKKH